MSCFYFQNHVFWVLDKAVVAEAYCKFTSHVLVISYVINVKLVILRISNIWKIQGFEHKTTIQIIQDFSLYKFFMI